MFVTKKEYEFSKYLSHRIDFFRNFLDNIEKGKVRKVSGNLNHSVTKGEIKGGFEGVVYDSTTSFSKMIHSTQTLRFRHLSGRVDPYEVVTLVSGATLLTVIRARNVLSKGTIVVKKWQSISVRILTNFIISL